ncbi:3-ketodihydrosphingosine reductase [Armadillidium vulgare]|nr:3-ketodihydrosphingosine reductase [Armadillidium vulgare]
MQKKSWPGGMKIPPAVNMLALHSRFPSMQRMSLYSSKIHIIISSSRITGGSSGIGLKVAEECLLEGANVTLLARDETKLNEAKESLLKLKDSNNDKLFGKIQVFSVDVSGPTSKLVDVVSTAEETFGSVYMLVNNAGFSRAAKFEELSETTVKNMMEVNFNGVVGKMKKAGEGGIIVFVSSQGGLFGIFGFTAYAASKGALVKFAEALHMKSNGSDGTLKEGSRTEMMMIVLRLQGITSRLKG